MLEFYITVDVKIIDADLEATRIAIESYWTNNPEWIPDQASIEALYVISPGTLINLYNYNSTVISLGGQDEDYNLASITITNPSVDVEAIQTDLDNAVNTTISNIEQYILNNPSEELTMSRFRDLEWELVSQPNYQGSFIQVTRQDRNNIMVQGQNGDIGIWLNPTYIPAGISQATVDLIADDLRTATLATNANVLAWYANDDGTGDIWSVWDSELVVRGNPLYDNQINFFSDWQDPTAAGSVGGYNPNIGLNLTWNAGTESFDEQWS